MKSDRHLIEKYFNGTASKEEAEKVLGWLQSEEGRDYLVNRFDEDLGELNTFWQDSSEGKETLKKIHTRIDSMDRGRRIKRFYQNPSIWAVAACISFLVAVVAVLEFQGKFGIEDDGPSIAMYSTSASEHRVITMSDGSRVRLNENSQIEIPEFFQPDQREVWLEGEAFFEINSDENRQFVVHAHETEVQVLGTAFMVRAARDSPRTMVAVREGKVAFGSSAGTPESRAILEGNMIGFFDRETSVLDVEEMAVTNYLTWMHGRVMFQRVSFPDVLRQLEHIYGIQHSVTDQELYNLVLTADFSERSLENVLETIAYSLGIRAELNSESDVVRWSN
jgi:transmembrane sensor